MMQKEKNSDFVVWLLEISFSSYHIIEIMF